MAVFDPKHLPDDESIDSRVFYSTIYDESKLSDYGTENIKILSAWYASVQDLQFDEQTGSPEPDIDPESEWKLCCRLMHLHHKKSSLQQVLSTLLSSTTIATPNLAKLAAILIVLPVTTLLRKNEPFIALNCVSGDLKFKIFRGRNPGPPARLVSRAVPEPPPQTKIPR